MPLRPPPTLGHPIDDALRRAILDWFAEHSLRTAQVWAIYLSNFGCGEIFELVMRLERRYGDHEAGVFRTELERRITDVGYPSWYAYVNEALTLPLRSLRDEGFRSMLPRLALLALSEAEFLTAIENTLTEWVSPARNGASFFINSRFRALGVPYAYGHVPEVNGTDVVPGLGDPDEDPDAYEDYEHGPFEFYKLIEPELEEHVIAPALRVLADDRLTSAADNYTSGLRRVMNPTRQELRDAVLDFARAVQETLYALAVARGKSPGSATAGALYGLLRNDPLPEDSEALVLAASKLRNPTEHPRGRRLDTQHAAAEAAMGAAAVAITYIATFMPGASVQDIPIDDTDFLTSIPADDDIPF
jgi:hypothetical protein